MIKDLYSILGVDRSVGIVEIRKAYRKRALELHPDVNRSSAAKKDFIELTEAYEILRNIKSRSSYDKLYNVYVLNLTPKNDQRFKQKEASRQNHFDRTTQTGSSRAESNSVKPHEKFTKETKRSSFWDRCWMILELILSIPTSLFS
jgi:curved DNA-binding protein CbpA